MKPTIKDLLLIIEAQRTYIEVLEKKNKILEKMILGKEAK
jgi:hypothetical protein